MYQVYPFWYITPVVCTPDSHTLLHSSVSELFQAVSNGMDRETECTDTQLLCHLQTVLTVCLKLCDVDTGLGLVSQLSSHPSFSKCLLQSLSTVGQQQTESPLLPVLISSACRSLRLSSLRTELCQLAGDWMVRWLTQSGDRTRDLLLVTATKQLLTAKD